MELKFGQSYKLTIDRETTEEDSQVLFECDLLQDKMSLVFKVTMIKRSESVFESGERRAGVSYGTEPSNLPYHPRATFTLCGDDNDMIVLSCGSQECNEHHCIGCSVEEVT